MDLIYDRRKHESSYDSSVLPIVAYCLDMKDIKFGVENGVDAVAASFVRRASDVAAIREALGPQV